jgi:phosphonoacetate hydrolase
MTQTITINDRDYTGLPTSTAIVICLDGSQKEYFEEASKLNLTPNLDKIINTGENLLANSAIPSFTNPNNISIVTGRPVQFMVFVAIFFILHLLEKKS